MHLIYNIYIEESKSSVNEMMHKSCSIFNGKPCLSPFLFTLLAFTILATIFYHKQDNLGTNFCLLDYSNNNNNHPTFPNKTTTATTSKIKLPFAIGEADKDCDVFSGRWVRDYENRPWYEEHECPYLWLQMKCQGHGRPDKEYMYWRWQPHGCSLPSFNATLMLESLRGKRMLFVGDSLSGGQYVSMVCLLQKVIPDHAKSFVGDESYVTFTAKDYNVTIHFYFAPYLLEASNKDRVVRKGSINAHGQHWIGFDIVVFNTYVWWMKDETVKLLQSGSFDDEKKDIIEVSPVEAYRMAIDNMLQWMKENMDPNKTRIFFTSMSPLHMRSIEWGGDQDGNCYNQKTLIEDPNFWPMNVNKYLMKLTGEMFSESGVPITLLNITQLSNYRKDAHTSIYKKQWHPLTKEEIANPATYADCQHWCASGLQDTWNELLFAKLFYP